MDEAQQKMDQKMDETSKKTDKMQENQEEPKRVIQENQEETKQAIEENNRNIESIKKEMVKKIEEIAEKSEKQEIEIKEIKIKMKEINNCQKKELENLEIKFENALQEDKREIERKMEEIRNQQNSGERRETIIHSTEDVKIRFGGDVKKLHPVIFINNLKKKVRYIGKFETAKETIRNHIEDEASLWFDSKEEELDNWHKFEQKFLSYFWGKTDRNKQGVAKWKLVELIARHFEDTLEDHITVQNYKDIDSLCKFLQIRKAKMRERNIRRSQENYRQRENQDYRDRGQNFRRDYTRREFIPRSENENRDNGRGNYEQRNRQWNEDRYRENQNRNNTRTYQEDRNDNRRNEQENRGNRYGSDRPRRPRRAVNNTQIEEDLEAIIADHSYDADDGAKHRGDMQLNSTTEDSQLANIEDTGNTNSPMEHNACAVIAVSEVDNASIGVNAYEY
uniref:Trichohyalin-like n=1 Tax=Diabrotica virgifera virgifera TaxID=50390 RepID=A0A6P7F1S2_DIAVI